MYLSAKHAGPIGLFPGLRKEGRHATIVELVADGRGRAPLQRDARPKTALWLSLGAHVTLAAGILFMGVTPTFAPPKGPVAVELVTSAPAQQTARQQVDAEPAPAAMAPLASAPPLTPSTDAAAPVAPPQPVAVSPAAAPGPAPAAPQPGVPSAVPSLQPGEMTAPARQAPDPVGTPGAPLPLTPTSPAPEATKPRVPPRAAAHSSPPHETVPRDAPPLRPAPGPSAEAARGASFSSGPTAAPSPAAPPVTVAAHPVAGMSSNHPPAYPALAQRRREEGRVLVQVAVGIDGTPLSVSVVTSSGHELLDAAAVTAVRGWRFVPASRNGVAIAASADVPVDFHLAQ